MTPRSRLLPIASVSCGPTAVCAVTGATSEEVYKAMMHAAKLDGESPSDLDNSAFRHQILAVKNLGFDVFNADGSPFDANKAPMNPSFDQPTYDAAPTIADYVTSNNLEDVVICYAARLSPQASHTFAADGQSFFDNNTGGKLVGVSAIHSKVSDMKVIQVLRVRRRA